ncbi:MAG: hypothetical protein JWN86_4382 [Planctomycetota bacterium]|nr:hypothetical protein [Planctomycetota bacterium]
MPNQKHGQPQQGRPQGGGPQDIREQAHQVADRIGEGASRVGERVREGYDATREQLSHRYRQAEGMIARNPTQSVLVGFGVGFGLGVLLTTLLMRREEESWYERYVPDRLRNIHLPESLSRHLPGH